MLPTIAQSERGRCTRSQHSDDDDSYSRSPSPAHTLLHRRSRRRSESPPGGADERSGVKKNYKMQSNAHRSRRGDDGDASPPLAKRRRPSAEKEGSPPRRQRKDERSRSPHRRERRSRDERRKRSRSPCSKEKRSGKPRESLSRSRSPSRRKPRRDYSASQSPPPRRKDRQDRRRSLSRSHSRDADRKSRKPLPSQEVAFKGGELDPSTGALDKPTEKEKPNFKPTGLLAKEANTVAGTKIVLKYNEPPEARKPPASQKWQLYIFKGDDIVDEVPLYTQSCWLLGREAAVADVHTEHPSVSKQHAVVQFRHSVKVNEFGDRTNIVRPYIIDLKSANGTRLNGETVKDSRYYEIRDKDMVKIGLSGREYVFVLPPSG